MNNEFSTLSTPGADTAIYIGPPPRDAVKDHIFYAHLAAHFRMPHLVSSERFKVLRSARFEDLFGPKSARTKRRLSKKGVLSGICNEDNLKYYIDLSPPTEEEDAIILVTELTCTYGVLTWFQAEKKYGINPTVVCGQDDNSLLPMDFHDGSIKVKFANKVEQNHQEEGGEPSAEVSVSAQKGPPSTGPPKSLSNEVQNSTKTSLSISNKSKWDVDDFTKVLTLTNTTIEEATSYLILANGDPDEAVALYFERGGDALVDGPSASRNTAILPQNENLNAENLAEVYGQSNVRSETASASPVNDVASESPKSDPLKLKKSEIIVGVQPEYSPLRHRSAIERLVHAINDGDPKLDSAPKMWNFFAIAKYFDCAAHEKVSGWITTWLLQQPNHHFIQANPEVAYRIGLGIQSDEITKNAFSILVGEKALLNVFCETHPNPMPSTKSVHGRKLELLDDDELNRIDHAATSFTFRILEAFNSLVGDDMAWMLGSRTFRNIKNTVCQTQKAKNAVDDLVKTVKDYVRGRIYWVLCRTYRDDPNVLDQTLYNVRDFYPGTRDSFNATYNSLNERERLFTRFFWLCLREENLQDGSNSTSSSDLYGYCRPANGTSKLARKVFTSRNPSGGALALSLSKKALNNAIHFYTCEFPLQENLPPTLFSPLSRGSIPGQPLDNIHGRINLDFNATDANESQYFSADLLLESLNTTLHNFVIESILYPQHLFHSRLNLIPTSLIDTLMCLSDREWAYLPLSIDGGLDDGSGGVFLDGEAIPNMSEEEGFKGGKRGVAEENEGDGDGWSEIATSEADSTVARASRDATDGLSTLMSDVEIIDRDKL